jgi:hypothetical protein
MLSLDDIRHLDAAEGWLELGHWVECFDALERIEPLHRSDAAVMALRWNLYNKALQDVIAADLALGMQRRFPDEPAGYIWRSISLEKLGCFQDAYDNLRPVAGKFPDTGIIPFFLATYACELGNLGEARAWLVLAFRAPDNKELKTKALDEERLEPFWRKIGEIR